MESTRKFKVIRHLVSQRMEQGDIQQLLEDLPTDSRDVLRESVAEILEKLSFLMEVRARVELSRDGRLAGRREQLVSLRREACLLGAAARGPAVPPAEGVGRRVELEEPRAAV